MVLFKTKSDQNICQNEPDCINHFKIFCMCAADIIISLCKTTCK